MAVVAGLPSALEQRPLQACMDPVAANQWKQLCRASEAGGAGAAAHRRRCQRLAAAKCAQAALQRGKAAARARNMTHLTRQILQRAPRGSPSPALSARACVRGVLCALDICCHGQDAGKLRCGRTTGVQEPAWCQ